jgi:uncharacterized protein (TIGR01732 family)
MKRRLFKLILKNFKKPGHSSNQKRAHHYMICRKKKEVMMMGYGYGEGKGFALIIVLFILLIIIGAILYC